MQCPKYIDWITLDTIAECYPVSKELYKKLWELTAEAERANKAQPLGGDGSDNTTEIPIYGGIYDNVLKHAWNKFTEDEQKELIKALNEEDLTIEKVSSVLLEACEELCNKNKAHSELFDAITRLKETMRHDNSKLRDAARQAAAALMVAVEKSESTY